MHIPERLVTQHGVTGIKVGIQGPQRQIYDRTYYLNILKQKNVDLQNEINKLNEEVETIKKDNQLYVSLERQFDDLIKEVRQLEGELADYNLALDKQRSDTKPEDIMAILYHIQAQNERQKHQLDDIFIQRKNKETEIAGIEEQVHNINLAFEERLNELDPDQRAQYEKLREENGQLEQEIGKRRTELEEVSQRLSQAENRLREDPTKERAQVLRDEKAKLQAKKEELQLQTDEMGLPFPEARERLLSKAKEDQQQMKAAEQRLHEVQKLVESYQRQLKDIDGELEENKAEGVDKKKYEILQERDKEYTDYIAGFESLRAQELEQVSQLEKKIAEQLEQMSRHLRKLEKVPTVADAENTEGEKKFRENLVHNEAETFEIAKREVEERSSQLTRMQNVEGNIAKSAQLLQDKMARMQEEIDDKYSKVGTVVAEAQAEKRRLESLKAHYGAHKDALREQVTFVSVAVDKKKNQLGDNETHKSLTDIERRLAENEGSLFSMTQFIESKKREANYSYTRDDCLSLVNNINNERIQEVLNPH